MELLLLVVLAVMPPIAFLLYIHHLDKIEPEPHGLIIKALALGGIAVIPAALVELGLEMIPVLRMGGLIGAFVKSFVVVAPVEEALKLAVVMIFIWKNKNFNEENDGIVYVGSAAIGFALVENIMYVLQHGVSTGIMRALTAVPLHTFTGVLMGYFVGIARCAPTPADRNRNIWKGFITAYVIHGAYDALVFSETAAALLMVPLVVVLFIFGFIYLKKGAEMSARRWGNMSPAGISAAAAPESAPAADLPPAPPGVYKIVVSRILITLSAGFWALLVMGMTQKTGDGSATVIELIGGGILITILPAVIAVILELSYYRQKKLYAAA
jgi:protease PrsW